VGLRATGGQCETLAEHGGTGIHAGWSNRFSDGFSRHGMVKAIGQLYSEEWIGHLVRQALGQSTHHLSKDADGYHRPSGVRECPLSWLIPLLGTRDGSENPCDHPHSPRAPLPPGEVRPPGQPGGLRASEELTVSRDGSPAARKVGVRPLVKPAASLQAHMAHGRHGKPGTGRPSFHVMIEY
jgi:hypothetical protein